MPKVQIEMEMPKSCKECPLQIGSNMDEMCVILHCATWENYNSRHRNCPLKEVK